MEEKLQFLEMGATLGTRMLGSEVRGKIEKVINDGKIMILDLQGVEVVSNSFADESFGKLVYSFNNEILREKIKFINMEKFVAFTIKQVIAERKKKLENGIPA